MPPPGTPRIRLAKARYLRAEGLTAWVGVRPARGKSIPQSLWDTCSVLYTRPDGRTFRSHVEWPVDGMISGGWEGEWGLDAKDVVPGPYRLVFEFAHQRTKPVMLTVVRDLPVVKQLHARFLFNFAGDTTADKPVPITFTVRNETAQTVRFPALGTRLAGVWVSLTRKSDGDADLFPFPLEKLLRPGERAAGTNVNRYDWDTAPSIQSIELAPGGRYDQQLILQDAGTFSGPGEWTAQVTASLPVLIGTRSGPYASYCPLTVPVRGGARFTVK